MWPFGLLVSSLCKIMSDNQQYLTGSTISTSSTKFVFFWLIGRTRWPPWPLIDWDIFDFFSVIAEWNLRKLDRKQDLNVLYQIFVCRADWKNKMAALVSDWLRHCTQVHDMWPFGPLVSSLCKIMSDNQQYLTGSTISTSSMKPLTELNSKKLDRKQDLNMSSTKFVFFRLMGK